MKITEVEIKTIDGRVSHMEADTVLVLGISEDGKNTGGCFGGGKINKVVGYRGIARVLARAMKPLFKNRLEPFLFLKVAIEVFEEEYKDCEPEEESLV